MSAIKIKCNKCEKVHSYDCSNLDWECVESKERNMGAENLHQTTIEETCSCGQDMAVIFNCWEYPVGAENMTEIGINGAEIVKNECPSCPNFH